MIIGKAGGIDVITIACKGFVGSIYSTSFLGLRLLLILHFLSSLIVIRRPSGLYSDRTFQVANRKSFLLLLSSVCIMLICPIFSSFSFVISVFFCGRGISPSHNLRHILAVSLPHWDQTLCVAAPLETRRYYFPLLH
jgi:hypothetical protein